MKLWHGSGTGVFRVVHGRAQHAPVAKVHGHALDTYQTALSTIISVPPRPAKKEFINGVYLVASKEEVVPAAN